MNNRQHRQGQSVVPTNTITIQTEPLPDCQAISNHPYNHIYAKYLVCNIYGVKKHVAYDYIDAINYIHDYKHKQVGNMYRDNINMYILGIPHICKCLADYKCIYIHTDTDECICI